MHLPAWRHLAAIWLWAVYLSGPVHGETLPNIVFILTDDQAPTAISAAGHPHLRTPHIDRLFADGATFVNSFVTTPVCSPSRAGLMASRYSTELAIPDWIHPNREPNLGLDPALPTWPEALQEHGYSTALVGKWHLGTAERFHPTKMGYQKFVGFLTGGTRVKDPTLEVDGENRKLTGLTTDILTNEAIKFLRSGRQPMLLSLHYRAPHSPWLPVADEDWAPYKNLDPKLPHPHVPNLDHSRVKDMTRRYLASVASIDRNVGRLLASLDETGLSNNTVVIFTSDHGYHMGHHGLWYKGNAQWQLTELPAQRWPGIPPKQRPNLYDQALRVPTAVRWPDVIKPGTIISQTITNLDWYPTLLAMAGLVEDADSEIRGRSFLPLIRGHAGDWNNDLFSQYDMRHGATTQMRAYRTPRWKLMVDFHNKGREELYDLHSDPHELTNLLESPRLNTQLIRQQLYDKLIARMQDLSDPATPGHSDSSSPPPREDS